MPKVLPLLSGALINRRGAYCISLPSGARPLPPPGARAVLPLLRYVRSEPWSCFFTTHSPRMADSSNKIKFTALDDGWTFPRSEDDPIEIALS